MDDVVSGEILVVQDSSVEPNTSRRVLSTNKKWLQPGSTPGCAVLKAALWWSVLVCVADSSCAVRAVS